MNYAYKKPDGSIVWRTWTVQEFEAKGCPSVIEVDGERAKRSFQAERAGVPATKGWPLTCVASGVNAAQAQELRDEFTRLGIPTEVTRDGDPVYTSAAHRRKALRARGFYDRAGYD